jgi:hypothetical protein
MDGILGARGGHNMLGKGIGTGNWSGLRAPIIQPPVDIVAALGYGQYPVVPLTRASVATYVYADGAIKSAPINAPRFDWTGGERALLLEAAATNASATVNVNPVSTAGITVTGSAVLSVVDDASDLASAGLADLCTNGKVYKFDGTISGGNSFAILAQTTSGIQQTVSAWVRGEGLFAILGEATFSFNHTAYTRASGTHTSTSIRSVAIRVNPGQVCYFILQQFENGGVASSEIPSYATSAVTRSADAASVALAAGTYDVEVVTDAGTTTLLGVVHAGGAYWPAEATGRVYQVTATAA